MIENMKVEFGRTSDIDSWMRLVRKVSWNFPGLETEQSIDEHKIIVLKFMNDKRALCVKNEQEIVGVLLYSRKYNMICCLAVDPAYRKRGIASLLLREAIDKLDRDKDITVSTFRENDVKGIAPRKLYKKFGLEEGELITLDQPLESEYSGESIEDISEDIMGVVLPQYSEKKRKIYEASKLYFEALTQAKSQEDIDRLGKRLAELEAEYSENPAYMAWVHQQYLEQKWKVKKNETNK